MQSSDLILQAEKILKQRNIAIVVSCVLLFSNFFLSTAVFLAEKEYILVPSTLEKEVLVSNGKLSMSYLEPITRDVINLMLSVTPQNTEYATNSILKITHPAFRGELKAALFERNQDVVKRRISLHFYPQTIVPGEEANTVMVTGKLSTYLGKEEVSLEDKSYSITYVQEGFRPLVSNFHEIDPKKKTEEEAKK